MNTRMGIVLISAAALQACEPPIVDPGPEPGPEWEHCPTADTYVGEDRWKRAIVVTNEAVFCEYPAQTQDLGIAHTLALRKQLRVVAGTYPMPDEGSGLDFSLPMCLRDNNGPLPGVVPGTANAGVSNFGGGDDWWVVGEQQHAEGGGKITINLYGDPSEKSLTVDGSGPYGTGLQFGRCGTDSCEFGDMSRFASCSLEPTTCDRFTFADGDALSLDQHHWVGMVGAGFAAITEARGRLAGTEFTISSRDQLFMSYGHHAFTRSGLVFFDEPIGEACGLFVEEVTSALYAGIWTTDCEGNPLEQLTVVDEIHEYQQGPCPQ